jgi:5S rRNA maturation endonuclease (ribonuclease M5)
VNLLPGTNYSTKNGLPWEPETLKKFAEDHAGPFKWKGYEGQAQCKLPSHNGQDKNPSFSFNAEKGTGHCFACHAAGEGLSVKELAAAWGCEMPPMIQKPEPVKPKARIVAVYDYTNAAGGLVYQSCRYDPKDFKQRRPDGKGGHIWSLDGVKPIPYRLSELLRALEKSKAVFIVEGEKDVDRLKELDITATTNSGGAGKWTEEHSKYFPAGSKVIILPDNDAPGRKHVQIVARSLHGRGCSVKIIELPRLPEKGDVSDWLDAGHTKDDLIELYKAAQEWTLDGAPEITETLPDEWEQPIPLRQIMNPPEFPCNVLPGWMGDFVKAESEFTQTPSGLAGSLSLAMAAASLAKKAEVMGRPGWFEGLNLYIAVAMQPGSRKSQVINDVSKPLSDYERQEAESLRAAVAQSESEYRRDKKRLDGLESTYASAKDPEKAGRFKLEADELARELAEKEVLRLPRYLAQDVTPERIASLLAEHGGKMAIVSAEGELFSILAGRYSSGAPNIEVFLKGHAGDQLRVDRQNKERQAVYVDHPALTIGVCLQPDVLNELPRVKGFTGRGLLARFLWVVPESNIGRRRTRTEPVPLKIAADYCSNMRKLLELAYNHDQDGKQAAWTLTLDKEAAESLDKIMEQVEKSLGNPEEMGAFTEWGSKFVGAVLRIAGILHATKEPGRIDSLLEPIQQETLIRALAIGDFLVEHAKAAFGIMDTDSAVGNAEFILRWLKGRGITRIQKKDLFRGVRSRFHKAAALDEPIKLLIDYSWLRESKEVAEGTYKPKTFYEVNPEINA